MMNVVQRMNEFSHALSDRITTREAVVGIIGLGYVGLPLAAASARSKFSVLGFDIDADKTKQLNDGSSYIDAVTPAELAGHVDAGLFQATTEFARLGECDVIVICVPTPLSKQRVPDL